MRRSGPGAIGSSRSAGAAHRSARGPTLLRRRRPRTRVPGGEPKREEGGLALAAAVGDEEDEVAAARELGAEREPLEVLEAARALPELLLSRRPEVVAVAQLVEGADVGGPREIDGEDPRREAAAGERALEHEQLASGRHHEVHHAHEAEARLGAIRPLPGRAERRVEPLDADPRAFERARLAAVEAKRPLVREPDALALGPDRDAFEAAVL